MYEIELKAHVNVYQHTKEIIDSFATYLGKKSKSDRYWKLKSRKFGQPIQIRIREETTYDENGMKSSVFFVTYKKKQLKKSDNKKKSINFEVNEEKEFTISDKDDFESVLKDIGFSLVLKKEKKVIQWKYNDILLELCTVPPLGDFLELEILSEVNDKKTIEVSLEKLKNLLLQCDIPLEKIEKRYYSELLQKAKK